MQLNLKYEIPPKLSQFINIIVGQHQITSTECFSFNSPNSSL